MMHTHFNEKHNAKFHFNSDFSGKVRIQDETNGNVVIISAEALLEFVAREYVLPKKIGRLERENYTDLLIR